MAMNHSDEEGDGPSGGDFAQLEVDQLRERLKGQSQLIAMLRERQQQLEEKQSAVCMDSSSRTADELATEKSRADALDRRFSELAEKFRELKEIKENYREHVHRLEIALRQKTEEQDMALQPVLSAKDSQIITLKAQIGSLEKQIRELRAGSGLNEYEFERQLKDGQTRIQELEEQLKEKSAKNVAHRKRLEAQLADLESRLKSSLEFQHNNDPSSNLENLVIERGELLAKKDRQICLLREEVEEWRQRVAQSSARFHELSSEVDVDSRVSELSLKNDALQIQLDNEKARFVASKSALEKQLQHERQSHAVLRRAQSISEIIRAQNALTNSGNKNEENG